MALNENELFGKRDKVAIAIQRIKEFEPMAIQNSPAGYHVCISGGKDSSVIQELCLMAGVKCEFVHNHTSVDHPETVYFVRREKERIEKMGKVFIIDFPRYSDGKQKTMWNLIPKKGLPTMKVRWCCQELKEYSGHGRYCITGVRWEESVQRSTNRALHEIAGKTKYDKIMLNNDNDMKRRLSESCIPKRKFVLNPIIDWLESDIWDFIHTYKVPYNPLYDMGYKRVGCVGCSQNRKKNKELEENPKYKAAYFRAAKKRIKYRLEKGLEPAWIMESPERYFNWWLNGMEGLVNEEENPCLDWE